MSTHEKTQKQKTFHFIRKSTDRKAAKKIESHKEHQHTLLSRLPTVSILPPLKKFFLDLFILI